MIRQPIKCADGFMVSVQASKYHYCTPREDGAEYEAVELGYPSAEETTLMPYCESPDRPTDTVYGFVPVEIVRAVVEKHGGCGDQLDWLTK